MSILLDTPKWAGSEFLPFHSHWEYMQALKTQHVLRIAMINKSISSRDLIELGKITYRLEVHQTNKTNDKETTAP